MKAADEAPRFTRGYLRVIAAITGGLGLGLLLLPSWVADLFFNTAGHDINFFVRMLGSTLIGYGVLNALAAREGTVSLCQLAVWGNLVTLLIASVVSISYHGLFTGYGWLVVMQHVVFAAGFSYCAWKLDRR